jgi:hypothetical protein
MILRPGPKRRLAAMVAVALGCCATPALATAATVPLPANAGATPDASVNSISCAAAGACSAVGVYTDSAGIRELLLLSQTGGTWSASEANLAALASASGGLDPAHGGLDAESISCASAGNCAVVGEYWDGTSDLHYRPFVLTQSGGVWGAATPVTLPSNADFGAIFLPYAIVEQVSCSSVGNCEAVGTYRTGSAATSDVGLLLSETGGTWTASEAPLPSTGPDAANGAPDVSLPSISCTAAGSCEAIGVYSLLNGGDAGLLLSGTAQSWASAAAPMTGLSDPSTPNFKLGDWSSGYTFGSVACPSAGGCVAGASYADHNSDFQGMLLTQGSSWTAATLNLSQLSDAAGTNPQVNLGSAACVSVGSCAILGSYADHSGHSQGLLVSQTNGSWAPATTVGLPSDQSSADPAVSSSQLACAAAGNCAGVLYYEDSKSNPSSELLSESGGQWSATELTTPAPSAVIPPSYDWGDVSCAPSGYCAAVTDTSLNSGTKAATSLSVLDAPGAFVTLSATGGPDDATVTWNPPASISDLPITGYTVTAEDQTTAANGGQTMNVSGSTSSATFTGLTPGNSYAFSVIPSNALGAGLPSMTGAIDVIPSNAELLAALRAVLVPTGSQARRKAILKARGYSFAFLPPWGGRVTIDWYYSHRVRRHLRKLLVAKVTLEVAGQHSAAVRVVLTRAGRRVLKSHRRLRLTSDAAYTAYAVARVTVSGSFSLR